MTEYATMHTPCPPTEETLRIHRRELSSAEVELDACIDQCGFAWGFLHPERNNTHARLMNAAGYTADIGHILEAAITGARLRDMNCIPQDVAERIIDEMRAALQTIDQRNPLAVLQVVQEAQRTLMEKTLQNLQSDS